MNAISPRVLGKPINRVDGRLKVTGKAPYAAEFTPKGVCYAFAVKSTISHGRITAIETAAAEASPGVRTILTHLNAPKLTEPKADQESGGGLLNEERIPLSDDVISYGGQYIALVVADTLEHARHAASLIKVRYETKTPALNAKQAAGKREEAEGKQR
jgi:xanthine dehydrogenase YagR molybdenum-binding subunit